MHLPTGDHWEVTEQRLVNKQRLQQDDCWQADQQDSPHPDQFASLTLQKSLLSTCRQPIDDVAQEPKQVDLSNGN